MVGALCDAAISGSDAAILAVRQPVTIPEICHSFRLELKGRNAPLPDLQRRVLGS
jgi:hypothetical protein